MDTVEWGVAERPAGIRLPRLSRPRWVGPPVAVWLVGAGVALAVTAEALPWASTAQASDGPANISLDNLSSVPVLGYYLCWMALLGMAGLVLTGRTVTRRAAAGVAFGFGAALAMVLAGAVRSILSDTRAVVFSGNPSTGFVSRIAASESVPLKIGPGLFAACGALGLVLAAVLVGTRYRTTAAGLPAAAPAAPLPDEPADLTVAPVEIEEEPIEPVDVEALYARPRS